MSVLYISSFEEAKRNNEIGFYRASHNENIACAMMIKKGISKHYDGYSLNTDFVKDVINSFGYDRTMFVLANTIQYFDYDGRIAKDNKEWANTIFIPKDTNRVEYIIENTGLVDIITSEVRTMYDALNLWSKEHCETEADFTNKITVLKPTSLKDEYKSPDYQLFYCESGFGCSPTARGRAVFGEFVADGERARFDRENFIGVLKPEYLPDKAKKFLADREKPSIKAQLTAAQKKEPKRKNIVKDKGAR